MMVLIDVGVQFLTQKLPTEWSYVNFMGIILNTWGYSPSYYL